MRDNLAAVLEARAPWTVEEGHVLAVLKELPDECIQVCVTSPPYFGLRSYKTDPLVWGGTDPNCVHDWQHHRYYVEGGGGDSSAEAFTQPGPGNIERLKKARWHEDDTCQKCGAWKGHLGLERTPEEYVAHLVEIFREVRRVLRKDGTAWINLGDSYTSGNRVGHGSVGEKQKTNRGADGVADSPRPITPPGLKPKDLCMIPARVALALQADGWWLRSDVIWAKPNPMPESVTDRPTKAHEYVFLLAKSEKYFYDAQAITEPASDNPVSVARRDRQDFGTVGTSDLQGSPYGQSGNGENAKYKGNTRNRRSVWTIATEPYLEAHFAVFPTALVEPCIKAGTSEKGACASCGAPHERQIRVIGTVTQKWGHSDKTTDARLAVISGGAAQPGMRDGKIQVKETVGWQPSCEHTAEPIPCVVLDPFCGSGTVGVVARKLEQRFIGIDLSTDYCEMARRRIGDTAPLLDAIPMTAPKDPMDESQLSLLTGSSS